MPVVSVPASLRHQSILTIYSRGVVASRQTICGTTHSAPNNLDPEEGLAQNTYPQYVYFEDVHHNPIKYAYIGQIEFRVISTDKLC